MNFSKSGNYLIARIGLFLFTVAIFLTLNLYFFSKPAAKLREKLWRQLDMDTLYLKDDKIVQGWIWDENADTVNGETKEKTIFVFPRSDCLKIEKNLLFYYLNKLI